MKTQQITCPECKSNEIIKRGKRKTGRGLVQRYCCKSCKKRFVENDGFYRMRNTEHKVTACLDMYFNGMSLRKIQEHLRTFFPHNCSHTTILKWVRKYSEQISKYTDTLKVDISPSIEVDEMEFKTKGKISWFMDVIDKETRFMVSCNYALSRNPAELTKLIKHTKEISNVEIKNIHTDGLQGYTKSIRKNFHHLKRPKHYVLKSSDKRFNWKVERLHENVRERTKIMRQFKALYSAQLIMKGYQIYYNFCRKHQGINCYPYQLAIPNLELGKNKWLDLIKLSKATSSI